MITLADYFGSHKEQPTEEVQMAARELLLRVNALLASCGFKTGVASGWRPPLYNAELRRQWVESGGKQGANTAVNSKHMTGLAVDLKDNSDQQIAKYLNANQQHLVSHGLWMESPLDTKGKWSNWTHLQSVPPKSNNRVFRP